MAACFKCGEAIPEGPEMALDAVCSKCSSYLHSCANCAFYDEYQKNPCRQTQAAFVHDRLTKNACTYFKVKSAGPVGGGGGLGDVSQEPRKARGPRHGRFNNKPMNSNHGAGHLNKNAPISPSHGKGGGHGGHNGGNHGGGGGGNSSDAKKKLESLFSS